MSPTGRITRQEWRWVLGWTTAILLLSCIPYAIAGQLAPEGWQFAGILVNPLDGHSYLAKMRQGFDGNWLFRLTYTPEPHQGVFIFVFYLALGHLAALFHLPLIWMFHLARLAAGFSLLIVAYRFIAQVVSQPKERRLAFVLLLTASGLGWLGAIGGAFPIDLWVPEAFVPYSLYANPHFPLGMALMLIIFQLVVWPESLGLRANLQSVVGDSKVKTQNSELTPALRAGASETQNSKLFIVSGLAAVALALILPFALLTVWAVLAMFLVWLYVSQRRLPWPQIWPTLGGVLLAAPVIGYDYWISVTQPMIAGWSAQNVTPAPAISDLLLGYGLVGLLAIVGMGLIVRQGWGNIERGEGLVLLWAITTLVLVYFPLELQRRLINGLHIPLCILAAIGLRRWLDRSSFKLSRRRLIVNGVITLGVLGTTFVWTVPLLGMLASPEESETTALFFLRREEIVALDWLRENSTPDNVILASPRLGMFVPGQTGARAFYGHPFETIAAEQKRAMAAAFYRGELKTVSPQADFFIYGPSEQALGQPQNLSDQPIVFVVNNTSVHKVVK